VNEPGSREAKLELGVELLAHLEREELALSDAVDRIETVTTSPTLTRDILDTAEKRGIIEREGARLRIRRDGTYVNYDSQVTKREGEFECRRCGTAISTGHFVKLDAGELGPFGSSCVRRVTGRDGDGG
jgi:DNA-binding Lrp family transcriptional regulator